MFPQESSSPTKIPLPAIYKSYETHVQQFFEGLNTDVLDKIRNKMKRKQNQFQQEQNINLIENQRGKIITEMKEHVELCQYPTCKAVQQMVILYGWFGGKPGIKTSKHVDVQTENMGNKDYLYFIVKKEQIGIKKTQCPSWISDKSKNDGNAQTNEKYLKFY